MFKLFSRLFSSSTNIAELLVKYWQQAEDDTLAQQQIEQFFSVCQSPSIQVQDIQYQGEGMIAYLINHPSEHYLLKDFPVLFLKEFFKTKSSDEQSNEFYKGFFSTLPGEPTFLEICANKASDEFLEQLIENWYSLHFNDLPHPHSFLYLLIQYERKSIISAVLERKNIKHALILDAEYYKHNKKESLLHFICSQERVDIDVIVKLASLGLIDFSCPDGDSETPFVALLKYQDKHFAEPVLSELINGLRAELAMIQDALHASLAVDDGIIESNLLRAIQEIAGQSKFLSSTHPDAMPHQSMIASLLSTLSLKGCIMYKQDKRDWFLAEWARFIADLEKIPNNLDKESSITEKSAGLFSLAFLAVLLFVIPEILISVKFKKIDKQINQTNNDALLPTKEALSLVQIFYGCLGGLFYLSLACGFVLAAINFAANNFSYQNWSLVIDQIKLALNPIEQYLQQQKNQNFDTTVSDLITEINEKIGDLSSYKVKLFGLSYSNVTSRVNDLGRLMRQLYLAVAKDEQLFEYFLGSAHDLESSGHGEFEMRPLLPAP